MDPVQKEVEGVNKAGQGLVQTAAPGIPTNMLESDLDMLNKRWSDLQEKVSKPYLWKDFNMGDLYGMSLLV